MKLYLVVILSEISKTRFPFTCELEVGLSNRSMFAIWDGSTKEISTCSVNDLVPRKVKFGKRCLHWSEKVLELEPSTMNSWKHRFVEEERWELEWAEFGAEISFCLSGRHYTIYVSNFYHLGIMFLIISTRTKTTEKSPFTHFWEQIGTLCNASCEINCSRWSRCLTHSYVIEIESSQIIHGRSALKPEFKMFRFDE